MSLKDALMKAGYTSSRTQNERQRKLTKEKTKTEKHQEQRNFCEVCECIHPDVERFRHRNPRIDAEWICSNCADKNEILDDFRVTAQSDFSKNGRYRRYYGHTRDFSKEAPKVAKDNRQKHKYKQDRFKDDSRGNRGPGRNKPHNKTRKSSRRYTVDENGDKNFNC